MDRVRRIELLVRAADAGSFARAAALLQIDPSALSHAIAELEKELRVRLFYRTTRKLQLTEDGEEIYRRGCDILRELAELENAVSKTPETLSGTLRVGMSVAVGRQIIMPRLPEFMRRHPGLRLECLVLTQVKDMHAGGLDVMLRAGDLPGSELVARRILDMRFSVYAAPSYLDAAGEPTSPDDLLRHRCLVHKPPIALKPLDEWEFERDGERKLVTVPCSLMTDDREGLTAAALEGGGLMRIGMFDPNLITSGRLRKVLADWSCLGSVPVNALYRRGTRMAPKIAVFLDFVAEAFEAFDPQEITLVHEPNFKDWLRSPAAALKPAR